jgi:hypothetical protein
MIEVNMGKTIAEVVDAWDSHRTKRYRFYMQTPDGKDLEWVGLTINQAKSLYNLSNKHNRDLHNMFNRMGWEEIK